MSLSLSLSNAVTGLNANQRAIATASNNISNSNTQGYSRQRLDVAAQYYGRQGQGVGIENISRRTDQFVTNEIISQTSDLAYRSALNEYQQRVQDILGQPGQENTLTAKVDSMFGAYGDLANNPESAALREAAMEATNEVARNLSTSARSMEELRFESDQAISRAISNLNAELDSLKSINADIAAATVTGEGTDIPNLLDERDAVLKSISQFVDTNVLINTKGQASVFTASGITLLDSTNDYVVRYIPTSGVDSVIGDTVFSQIEVVQLGSQGQQIGEPINLVEAGNEGELQTELQSGEILGLLEARNIVIPEQLDALDKFADSLINEANAIHNRGNGYPSANEFQGQRFSDPAEVRNWSGTTRIAVLTDNGNNLPASYVNEDFGMGALDLNFDFDSGEGEVGQHSTQTIIDEINAFLGIPQNKVQINNLNDIKLVAMEENNPPGGTIRFDFQFENLFADLAQVDITGIDINAAPLPAAALPTGTIDVELGARFRTGDGFAFDATGLVPGVNTIDVTVDVTNFETGLVETTTITFQVDQSATDIRNDRYAATAVTAPAILRAPTTGQSIGRAYLATENGVPVGVGQAGYLVIEALNDDHRIAINDVDSSEDGILFGTNIVEGSGEGFSHFFGMNNMFDDFEDATIDVDPSDDPTTNKAININLREDIERDSALLSAGRLELGVQPVDPDAAPNFTYDIGISNNVIANELADLGLRQVNFASSDLISEINDSFSSQASTIISKISSDAEFTERRFNDAEFSFQLFKDQLDSISGVNVDEELANLIIYQNAYAASSRVITVTDEVFEELLGAFR